MKRITQENLQAMYPPVPEDFAVHALSGLPHEEEEIRMKRKLSVALVLAAVLTLLTVGAFATAANWNVLTFLYGEVQPTMEPMLAQVTQRGSAGGVTLEISTAMTDGRSIAFDWTLTVEDDALPVYLQTDDVKVAGSEDLWLDSLGGLNRVWLTPEETTRHSGELIWLENRWMPGEEIAVELTLGVYKPLREVVIFTSTADRAKAEELAAQGVWTVVPETEMIGARQQNQVWPLWRYDKLTEEELADYERSEIKLSFTVTVPEVEWEQLATDKEAYEVMPGVSFRVTEAYRTPLNIWATIDIAVAGEENQLGAMKKWNKLSFALQNAEGRHISQLQGITLGIGITTYFEENGVYHQKFTICTGAYDAAEFAEDDGLYLVHYIEKKTDREGYHILEKKGRYELHVVK